MLAAILKWTLSQQGAAEDAPATSSAPPISESDRVWLKEALESVMVNHVKRIKQLAVLISLPETEEAVQTLVAQHGSVSAAAQVKQNDADQKKTISAPSSTAASSSVAGSTSSVPSSSAASSTASVLHTAPLALGLPPSDTIYDAQPQPQTSSASAASSTSSSASASAGSPSSPEQLSSTVQEILAIKRSSLEELEDLVSHLDHADDFVAIGGLPHLLNLFHSNDAAVRWRAAAVLSTLIDNHQKTAEAALKLKALEAVIRLLEPPSASSSTTASSSSSSSGMSDHWLCVAKCLGCLSAFLRSETKAADVFLTLHGPVRVAALLSHSPPPPVLRKAFAVLRLSVSLFPSTSSLFLPATANASRTPALLSFCPAALRSSDLNVREECARFLAHLCKSAPLAHVVGDDSLGIRAAVNGRRKAIQDTDAEEKEGLVDESMALEEVSTLCHF